MFRNSIAILIITQIFSVKNIYNTMGNLSLLRISHNPTNSKTLSNSSMIFSISASTRTTLPLTIPYAIVSPITFATFKLKSSTTFKNNMKHKSQLNSLNIVSNTMTCLQFTTIKRKIRRNKT